MRTCERNNYADTGVEEEEWEEVLEVPQLRFGGTQGSRDPLTANAQPHVRASGYMEEGCDSVGSPGGTRGPMERGAYAGAGLLSGPCRGPMQEQSVPEGPTLEHFVKNCSLWQGLMLEKFVGNCLLWERLHVRAGKGLHP